MSLEVGARFLNLHLFGGDVGTVACLDGFDDGIGKQLFDVHLYVLYRELYIFSWRAPAMAADDGRWQ